MNIDLRARYVFDYLTGCNAILNLNPVALYEQFDFAMAQYLKMMDGAHPFFSPDLGFHKHDGDEDFSDFVMSSAPSVSLYVAPDPSGMLLAHPPAFYPAVKGQEPLVSLYVLNRPITRETMISGIDKGKLANTGSHFPLRCFIHLGQAGVDGSAGEYQGQYTVYLHRFCKREDYNNSYFQYVGITKRGWTSRFRQHLNEARNGSPYLFHRALAECTTDKYVSEHYVTHAGLSFEDAMMVEEKLVAEHTLNALHAGGLNMIPGGFAGIRFLGARGFKGITPKKWEHRASLVRDFNAYCQRAGKPNAALSLKWTVDDFAAKMILSNPNNLNRDQVSRIRTLSNFGMSAEEISSNMQLRKGRVARVLHGTTYSRVKS